MAQGPTPSNFTLNSAAYGGAALLFGQAGNDTLTSGAGNDTLFTGGGSDTVDAGAGNDTIVLNGPIAAGSSFNGGAGDDTVAFFGASTDYSIAAVAGEPGVMQVGNARLTGIEHLQFSDGVFNLADIAAPVTDGYVAGATVWADDGNGVRDPYEPFAITDAHGFFDLFSYIDGPLLAVGGTNIDTGLPNDIVLSAPKGSTVINPLTTLIQAIVESTGVTAEAAEIDVKEALGLDPSLDLTSLDLIKEAAEGNDEALAAQKAATAIAEVLDAVADAGGNADNALQTLAEEITTAPVGEPLNLADAGLLSDVYSDAGVPAANVAQLVEETQQVIQGIQQADNLDEISEVQANDLATIAGTTGKDVLTGTADNEKIMGGNGNDRALGGGGSDRIYGENGNDELDGGEGIDLLAGGNGNDTLQGGAGADVLWGGKGADRMSGGSGADIFGFIKGDAIGGDVIVGFEPSTDRLYFAPGVHLTGQAIVSGSTILALSDGGSIKLDGVTGLPGNLSALINTVTTPELPVWAQSWAFA